MVAFAACRRSLSGASALAYDLAIEILQKKENEIKQKLVLHSKDHRMRDQLVLADPRLLSDWNLNKIELKIPKFCEMSNYEWVRNQGPQVTRLQAKINKLIPDILPDESEAMLNMACTFADNVIGRGHFLHPEQCAKAPVVRFSTLSTASYTPPNPWYSFIFLDCDYPKPSNDKKLHQMALWMVANLNGPPQKEVEGSFPLKMEAPYVINDQSPNQILPYLPPHPARGIGLSRYACVLLSHSKEIAPDPQILLECSESDFSNPENRIFNLTKLIKNHDLHVASFSWFTSTWTKFVSELYTAGRPLHGLKQFVYGIESRDKIYDIPPYRFQHI